MSALEILVLGFAAAWLVLLVIPNGFTIESECLSEYGSVRIAGDTYMAAAAVVGTFGWLAVIAGAIYARIVESSRVSLLLPPAWFAVFVGGFLVAAVAIGPQPCPS